MQALSAVLGDSLGRQELAELLGKARGDPERALNLHFSAPQNIGDAVVHKDIGSNMTVQNNRRDYEAENSGSNLMSSKLDHHSGALKHCGSNLTSCASVSRKSIPLADGPMLGPQDVGSPGFKLLGEAVVVGYTIDDVDPAWLTRGEKVTLKHTAPEFKVPHGGRGKGKLKQQQFFGKKAKAAEGIVRWSIQGKDSCGRLPSDLSSCLFVLLCNSAVRVTCCVSSPPDSAKRFANVCLSMSVSLSTNILASDRASPEVHLAVIKLLAVLHIPCVISASSPDDDDAFAKNQDAGSSKRCAERHSAAVRASHRCFHEASSKLTVLLLLLHRCACTHT